MSVPKTVHPMGLQWTISAGRIFSIFHALLQQGKMAALRCGQCGTVYLPPRPVCGDCYLPLTDWVEVAQTGTVEAFTIAHHSIIDPVTGEKRKTPAAFALVKLDGADTSMQGWIVEEDFSKLAIGRRVKMVWKEPRRSMGDLMGFKYTDEAADPSFPRPIEEVPPEDPSDVVPVKIPIAFSYDAGKAGEWFFRGLREGKILGSRCGACSKVLVPARSFCPTCFRPLDEGALQEVGPWGTVVAAAGGEEGRPALALIRLDGADTCFLHRTLAPPGSRVRAKFRPSGEPEAETIPLLLLDVFEAKPMRRTGS